MFLKQQPFSLRLLAIYNQPLSNPPDNLESDYRRLQYLTETGLHDVNTLLLYLYPSSETLPYLVEIDEP
jgi:hypothetical protein